MNVLSLFSGIGGLDLGLERAGLTIVGQVEINPWCRRVLAKHWPEVPRHEDVHTVRAWYEAGAWPRVDILCGGFPCQPISDAGTRLGKEDPRWLWPATAQAVRDFRPQYVILENVPAIRRRGLSDILGDLASLGYDVQWDCIPAQAIGSNHRRDRWFALAYTTNQSRQGKNSSHSAGVSADVAYTNGTGWQAGQGVGWAWPTPQRNSWWAVEPNVDRMAHGIPRRVDRVRGLGNAVVPQVAEHIGRILVEFHRGRS